MKNRDVRLCGIAWLHPETPFCTQTGLCFLTRIGSNNLQSTLISLPKESNSLASLRPIFKMFWKQIHEIKRARQ